jgi:hypothetical protein
MAVDFDNKTQVSGFLMGKYLLRAAQKIVNLLSKKSITDIV